MSKIICNSIAFVFLSEVQRMTPAGITLKPGYVWKELQVTEKPVYRSEINQVNPGPVKEETVTAITKYDSKAILKDFSNFPILLRMKTDKETFFVGSEQYPVLTEINDDHIYDNYSFKCKSEV